jgi:hypothetical protein
MDHTMRVALLSALFLCLGWGAFAEPARDVRSIVDSRASLTGHKVMVEGFLIRKDNYYYLFEGAWHSRNEPSDQSKEYWCNFSGSPNMLWFAGTDIASRDLRRTIPDRDLGRHVVISGVFYNETSGEQSQDENPYDIPKGKGFAEWEIGPLRHVKVEKMFPERCNGDRSPVPASAN